MSQFDPTTPESVRLAMDVWRKLGDESCSGLLAGRLLAGALDGRGIKVSNNVSAESIPGDAVRSVTRAATAARLVFDIVCSLDSLIISVKAANLTPHDEAASEQCLEKMLENSDGRMTFIDAEEGQDRTRSGNDFVT
jgi:hypothetical protein